MSNDEFSDLKLNIIKINKENITTYISYIYKDNSIKWKHL